MAALEPFTFSTERDRLSVALSPEFSGYAESLEARSWTALQPIVESGSVRWIVADLSKLGYFGSRVLEALVSLWKMAQPRGGRLIVLHPSPVGREVLEVSGFDRFWQLAESPEEAERIMSAPNASNDRPS